MIGMPEKNHKNLICLPQSVARIIQVLNDGGYEAYVVGGCVRDCLRNSLLSQTSNIYPTDWDITTSAEPEQVKRLFKRTYDTGIAHGTVTVVMDSCNYEVTTFRIDGEYLDGRHPEYVDFTRSLTEDLRRRDFTMNAIAWHPEQGYIDPFGGIADIEAGLVRGVGDAGQRFREDALRMLRAVRFSAQLGFEIEPATWSALLENAPLIKNISIERVRDELLKLLISRSPEKITLVAESGLMGHIDPELAEHIDPGQAEHISPELAEHISPELPGQLTPGTARNYQGFDPARLLLTEPDANLRLAVLLRGLGGTKNRLKYFKLDNKAINTITTLLDELETPVIDDYTHIRRRLAKTSPELFSLLLRLFEAYGEDMTGVRAKLNEILSQGHCISLRTLAISGDDLKNMGITDGRTIGRTLDTLLGHVLANPENNTAEALRQLTEAMRYRQAD
jgi:tRNA nucleotidyltransferase (CCA-adding enzyme)